LRFLLPTIALAAAWLAMQAIHELGHVLAAVLTGGVVENVNLHPLSISRTDLAANPHPLLVVWAGPIVGVAIPALAWAVAAFLRLKHAFLLRFFAGFALVANGAYIGFGSFDRIGDCGDMLRAGSPIWTLWLFGIAGVGGGFLAWHRLGPKFGLGASAEPVPGGSTTIALLSLVGLLGLGILVGT
jgi:hypothetical protein